MEFPEHFTFTNGPTPIEKLSVMSKQYAPYEIYLKRDDLTGAELSGNKVRKLDFLMADAIKLKAQRIITCGGIQSNHCRAAAFYARKLGLKATLVLKGEPPEKPTGNFLLNQLVGADIKTISEEEYKQIDVIMKKMAASYDETTYVIPEGGSNFIGAWGYAKAFQEILEQMPDIETIVVATGSGGTHAGLLLGKILLKSPVHIFSVNVCDDASFFKTKIVRILKEVQEHFELRFKISEEDVNIIDGFVGEGYARVGHTELEAIKQIAQSEGFILDPVYGIKAWLGFEDHLKKQLFPGKKIMFIHTGGIFGLFPFAEKF